MTTLYPDYSNAYAGQPEVIPTGALTTFAHNGTIWSPATLFKHSGGAWRPVAVWELPAATSSGTVFGTMSAVFGFNAAMDANPTVTGSMSASFGFSAQINGDVDNDVLGSASASFGFTATMAGTAVPPVQSGTTVIFISDLLLPGETLNDPVDNTRTLIACLDRLVRRTAGTAASTTAITTPHVTVDWEGRYIICEGNPTTLDVPTNGALLNSTGGGSVGHACDKWPGGMTWRNGGVQAKTDDGVSYIVLATTTSGSTAITATTGTFLPCSVGYDIIGNGIPASTTIATVVDGTHATISKPATSSGGTRQLTIGWDYGATFTTAGVTVPADTATTFSVPVVTTVGTTDFTDAGQIFRLGDKETGIQVHWATKTNTQFDGCTRSTAGTSTVVASGTNVIQWKTASYNPAYGRYPTNRNRTHLRLQQSVHRRAGTNAQQMFEFNNFWIKGPNPTGKYVLAREGQEAFFLTGQQWIRFVDCKIEFAYADAWNIVSHASTVQGRDNDVHAGMIEVLGGFVDRIGIMNMTWAGGLSAPDAVYVPGWWNNDPDHKDWVPEENLFASESGTQYGIWWHGNAAHPYLATGLDRSIIDMEVIGSYMPISDVRIGADDVRDNFKIIGGGIFFNTGTQFGMQRRWVVRHVLREGGAEVGLGGSPTGVLDAHNQRVTHIASLSNNQTFNPAVPTTVNVLDTTGFPASGRLLIETSVAGVPIGSTHVNYTAKTSTSFTGCTKGYGTMLTGNTVRDASARRAGTNLAAAMEGVVLPADRQTVGTGTLFVHGTSGMVPDPKFLRIWTASGTADVEQMGDETANEFNNVRMRTGSPTPVGQGFVLHEGQAVTIGFGSAEREHYTVGDIVIDDLYATEVSTAIGYTFKRAENVTVINCRSPYRSFQPPFSENLDVPGFNKGGTSQFGSNNFFPI